MSETKNAKLLRAYGFRRTPGRLKLLAVLKAARRPLSHADICERMGRSGVNRVTVYRALDAFAHAGLVHRALVDERMWIFELSDHCSEHQCHPHFTCNKCGRVACLTRVTVPLARNLPKGYVAERQKVHITGLCASCSAQSESGEK